MSPSRITGAEPTPLCATDDDRLAWLEQRSLDLARKLQRVKTELMSIGLADGVDRTRSSDADYQQGREIARLRAV